MAEQLKDRKNNSFLHGLFKSKPFSWSVQYKRKKNGTKEREDGKPRLKDSQGLSPCNLYLILATSLPLLERAKSFWSSDYRFPIKKRQHRQSPSLSRPQYEPCWLPWVNKMRETLQPHRIQMPSTAEATEVGGRRGKRMPAPFTNPPSMLAPKHCSWWWRRWEGGCSALLLFPSRTDQKKKKKTQATSFSHTKPK